MSGPRTVVSQLNGSNRKPSNSTQLPFVEEPISKHHNDLIQYIYSLWNTVEQERGANSAKYYHEEGAHQPKDFQPFDLDAHRGRRSHQNIPQQRS